LAVAAFRRTSTYDSAICDFFSCREPNDLFPESLALHLQRSSILRYGENPHQAAALYAHASAKGVTLAGARQLCGKQLSYNNLLDLDSALGLVRLLPAPAAVVIKHNNPCGTAVADTLAQAMHRAWEGDPTSAFGSVIGVNQSLDAATAEVLVHPDRFVEAILAPEFDPQAVEILTTRPKWKASVRLVAAGSLAASPDRRDFRQIAGGFLVQQPDTQGDSQETWQVVSQRAPTPEMCVDLSFAWDVCRHVKSNAIVLANGRAVVGVGAGQMSRVDAVDIAIRKAGPRSRGAVLASDAFFPFEDSIHRAAEAGVSAIIQPGGSRRDAETIAACNQHSLPMLFTGRRHFKH
jgi:phosphoribosylaminoimidazolecarboxamide formyltransferase/IMP cyclohydrolase